MMLKIIMRVFQNGLKIGIFFFLVLIEFQRDISKERERKRERKEIININDSYFKIHGNFLSHR